MKEYDDWLGKIAKCQDEVERMIHSPNMRDRRSKVKYIGVARVRGTFEIKVPIYSSKHEEDVEIYVADNFHEYVDGDNTELEVLDVEYEELLVSAGFASVQRRVSSADIQADAGGGLVVITAEAPTPRT